MIKRGLALALCVVMCLFTIGTGFAVEIATPVENDAPPVELSYTLDDFHGVWHGVFPMYKDEATYINDAVIMDINSSRTQPILFQITSIDEKTYIAPNNWRIEGSVFSFDMYEGDWLLEVQLSLQGDMAIGTFTQKGREMEMSFTRISNYPRAEGQLSTEFVFENKTGAEWLELLRRYPSFSATGESINYSYELYNRSAMQAIIDRYEINTAMPGKTDIEVMEAMLDLICDTFRHDGSVPIPKQMDPVSIIAVHDTYGGIECRGLSVLLSELLRVCGIEAKPVMCISAYEPAECHVLVQAYSTSQRKWVMLDPSYRVMLKDSTGQYMSLAEFREALIYNDPIYARENASHNGVALYLPYYKAYMAKNTFRFANATDFYYGVYQFSDTDIKGNYEYDTVSWYGQYVNNLGNVVSRGKNVQHMLVPVGYEVPYRYSRSERVTTSADSFWAAPKR